MATVVMENLLFLHKFIKLCLHPLGQNKLTKSKLLLITLSGKNIDNIKVL